MFKYRLTCGWIRDLASQPTPNDPWPCIRWDDSLARDQERFLDAQAELGVEMNSVWGLFVDRAWPSNLAKTLDAERAARVRGFTDAAHRRGLKVVSGVGIYSWGFDQIIKEHPQVAASGSNRQVMCPFRPDAWDWQRRVLDYLMEERWGLDGVSMQSADQGRCDCPQCAKRSAAEHHADILIRSAQYVRRNRPNWVVGTACWGLRVDEPAEFEHIKRMAAKFDYVIEVNELTAEKGIRPRICRELGTSFGSVGSVFVEPPQHWQRDRWFLPTAHAAAAATKRLYDDGGRASENYYRLFANPGDEVSWRSAALMLSKPHLAPQEAVRQALTKVYGATGAALDQLADWFERAQNAYLTRTNYKVGQGPISLEPLIWDRNPSAAGPAIYLRDRMTPQQRAGYAAEVQKLRREFAAMRLPNDVAAQTTTRCLDGALAELASLG